MLNRTLSTLFLLALVATVPAGAAIIVTPNANAATEGISSISGPFQSSGITFQWLIAASQFAAINPGDDLTAIGFRLNANATNQPAADSNFTDWRLALSPSLFPIGSLGTSFAGNLGPGAVTVRSGPLTIAASSFTGGPGPNPFTFISFTTPYTYSGGDLLVTLTHTGGSNGFSNDGVSLESIPGLADTVLTNSYNAGSGQAGFFNVPVTAFETASAEIPEPSTLLLAAAGLGMLSMLRRRAS